MLRLESLPGQENMIILLQFYSLFTGYLLSSVLVTKYYYLPIIFYHATIQPAH